VEKCTHLERLPNKKFYGNRFSGSGSVTCRKTNKLKVIKHIFVNLLGNSAKNFYFLMWNLGYSIALFISEGKIVPLQATNAHVRVEL
jgi:hypothetical protein